MLSGGATPPDGGGHDGSAGSEVHGSVLGAGVVEVGSVVVVLVGSELWGAGVVLVVVVAVLAGVVVVVAVVLTVPELPAAATVGVVGSARTVASVCVWVRPGGTLGLALALGCVLAASVVVGLVAGSVF